MDANGSTTPAALTFYKRAKALYDANYEDDRVTIVQALVLMGWYWEGPEDVTKNVFYWSRVATIVAQGSGMHRSVEGSQLSKADKRLWKRIWWTLFTRDRSVAVALGRPVHINTDDSDVEMVSEEDFIEDDSGEPPEFSADPLHVQFFLQYVKLCEIMDLFSHSNTQWHQKLAVRMPLTSLIVIWHWRTGFKTAPRKFTGNRPGIISGLLCFIRITTLHSACSIGPTCHQQQINEGEVIWMNLRIRQEILRSRLRQ